MKNQEATEQIAALCLTCSEEAAAEVDRVVDDLRFTAPELHGMRWGQVIEVLEEYADELEPVAVKIQQILNGVTK